MRISRLLVPVTLAVVALGAASLQPSDTAASARTVEVARIRAHFDSVVSELGARDIHALTPVQRTQRAALLTTLRAYRDRGVFPHNYDFPGQAVPYFVDRKTGTLCAVAHLLASTGRRDIVDRVAVASNNALVANLAGDTALSRWLDANGLTLAEAARIQVPYMNPGQPRFPVKAIPAPATVAAPYALGAAAVAGAWNAIANRDGRSRSATFLGLATGAAALGTGIAILARPDAPRSLGMASAAVGTLGAALATRAFVQRRTVLARRDAAASEVSVTPLVEAGREASAGVAVTIRF